MEGETLELVDYSGGSGRLGVVRGAKYGDPATGRYADEATVAEVVGSYCTGYSGCTIPVSNIFLSRRIDPAPGVKKSLKVIIEDGSPTPEELAEAGGREAYDQARMRAARGEPPLPRPAATPAPTTAATPAPTTAATPAPTTTSFGSFSSMFGSTPASTKTTAETATADTPPTDSHAAKEPVEFNWPVIGTIIGTVTVLILVTVFYPRSNPVATGARRVKRI
jgi:hypothetical protein